METHNVKTLGRYENGYPWPSDQVPSYKIVQPVLDRRIRAMHLKQNKLHHFKITCVLDTGEEIWAPDISDIQLTRTQFGHVKCIGFTFKKIKLFHPVGVETFNIIDDLGFLCVSTSCPGYFKEKFILGPFFLDLL